MPAGITPASELAAVVVVGVVYVFAEMLKSLSAAVAGNANAVSAAASNVRTTLQMLFMWNPSSGMSTTTSVAE